MKKTLFYCIPFLLGVTNLYAQKIKSDEVTYYYNKPPAASVDKTIKNYQVTLEPVYEANNQQLQKAYELERKAAEDKYRIDMAAYPALVKIAEDKYASEMAEYSKKSLGTKIVESQVMDSHKPVKHLPQQPNLRYPPQPALQTSYDYNVLATTYINLESYQNAPDNALKIVVKLYGYDHTQPRTMDEQQENISLGGGNNSAGKVTYYHTEFSYRHPMSVKVFTPAGKEILSITPPELNSYKIYKGEATTKPSGINPDLLIKTSEQNILQANLKFINNLLNDKFGFTKVKRVAILYYIKNGDEAYADLTTAFNETSSALLMLQQDKDTAKAKLDKSCALWKTALDAADLTDKKARINKDVAIAVSFNLLEAYFAESNTTGGQAVLDKMNTFSLSNSERRTKNDFEMLFTELKARLQNN